TAPVPGRSGLTPEDPPPRPRPKPAPPPAVVRREPPRVAAPSRPLEPGPRTAPNVLGTVSVDVVNPPMGLQIEVDGQPSGLPVRLPRDGKDHHLEFRAPKFQRETRVLRGDRNRSLYLDNTPVI